MNKEYENISFFLDGCTKYGLNKSDLFQVIRKIKDQRKNAPVSPVKHVKIIRWPFSLSRDSQTIKYLNSLFIASQAFYVGTFQIDLLDRGPVRRLQRSASPNDDFQARWNGEKEGLCRASDWRQNCKQERTKFHWRAAQRRTEHHRTTGKEDFYRQSNWKRLSDLIWQFTPFETTWFKWRQNWILSPTWQNKLNRL